MHAQFVTISRFDFAKDFAVLVARFPVLFLAPALALLRGTAAAAGPGAMACFIIANKAQSLLLHAGQTCNTASASGFSSCSSLCHEILQIVFIHNQPIETTRCDAMRCESEREAAQDFFLALCKIVLHTFARRCKLTATSA